MLRSVLSFAAAALLGLGVATAHAGDSQLLAEHAGFLLGNAHRCGVPSARVVKAGATIQKLIAAVAADTQEGEKAITRFAEFFLATSSTDVKDKALTPGCKRVIGEFEKLEHHSIQVKDD
jgi:hypothetical protein